LSDLDYGLPRHSSQTLEARALKKLHNVSVRLTDTELADFEALRARASRGAPEVLSRADMVRRILIAALRESKESSKTLVAVG